MIQERHKYQGKVVASFFNIFTQEPPLRKDLSIERTKYTYKQLLQKNFNFFRAQNEYIVIGPAFSGKVINDLLYISAPSKLFGLDTKDIIKDWTDLYEDPSNKNRLKAHQQIPGWDLFERGRAKILDSIKGTNAKQICPVIRIIEKEENQLDWNLETGGYDISSELLVGLLTIAALSPEITNSWESYQSYYPSSRIRVQNMGSTQVLPLIVKERRQLLQSRVTKSIIKFSKLFVTPS